jgi:hypothetical protein
MSEKKSWADIQDEEDKLTISKHGIKVKYTPPHERPDKSPKRVESKKDDSSMSSMRRGVQ